MQGDIFLNEIFVGTCENPEKFVENFRNERRRGKITSECNISYDSKLNFVMIESSPGRLRRPLIVVEKGKSRLTKELNEKLVLEELSFNDLVEDGVIEYLDAMEENDCYVALSEKNITVEHTHMEVSPILMFGLNTVTVPFSNYDEPSRLMRGQKTVKQSMGMYALNYLKRKETDRNLLVYPQKPLVDTFVYDLLGFETHPAGQNLVVAVMSFEGYNMEDGLILNQSSIERGLQRSFYYKVHSMSEIKYPGGLQDRISLPLKDVKGYRMEEDYRYLEDDGIIFPGQVVGSGDILVGKVSPPRFVEEIEGFGQMINLNIDSSMSLKEEEKGVVSSVLMIENSAGDKEVNVLLRDQRLPVVGDKFASRHGQKGIIGAIYKQSDLPFSEMGLFLMLFFLLIQFLQEKQYLM